MIRFGCFATKNEALATMRNARKYKKSHSYISVDDLCDIMYETTGIIYTLHNHRGWSVWDDLKGWYVDKYNGYWYIFVTRPKPRKRNGQSD